MSVLMVISLAAMAMMAALALDGGHMMLNKTRLQNAVDAAALSGAKTLRQMEGGVDTPAIANATRAAALNTLTFGEFGRMLYQYNVLLQASRDVQLSLQNFVFNLFIPGFDVSITLPAFRATLLRESLGRHSDSGEITPC
nr:Tad domain-containing protein [Pseudomonas sp. GL-R-19]